MNSKGAGGKKGNGPDAVRKPSARRKRIERLKAMVEKGTYRVNPKEIAEKMIEDAVRAIRSRHGSE